MLNPIQWLFGGAQQQSNQTSQSTPVNVNPFTNMYSGDLTRLISGGTPQYSGPLNANMTGNEGDILGDLMGQRGGPSGRGDYLSDVIGGKYLPGQEGQNPFFDAAVKAAQRPTLQGLEETLSRSLPGRFTAAGHMLQPNENGSGGSSAFDRAAAVATRGVAQAVGDIATNMGNTLYGLERNNQQQAVQLSQQEVQTSIQNLQAQSLPRMISELGIERGLGLFQTNVQALLSFLNTVGQITRPVVGQESFATGSSTGTSTNGIFKPIGPSPGSGAGTSPTAA